MDNGEKVEMYVKKTEPFLIMLFTAAGVAALYFNLTSATKFIQILILVNFMIIADLMYSQIKSEETCEESEEDIDE